MDAQIIKNIKKNKGAAGLNVSMVIKFSTSIDNHLTPFIGIWL
jgi:hypothetical protein